MAMFYHNKFDNGSEVAIWHIEESATFFKSKIEFLPKDTERLNRITVPHKQLEWLASRYLLKKLIAANHPLEMDKTTGGKPYIKGLELELSLSHSKNYVAVMLSKLPCGIDIEEMHPKIHRIEHKFLRPEELDIISAQHKMAHTYQYWSAKEAMYKFYGLGRLRFKEHIWITPFSYDAFTTTKGRVVKNDFDEQCTITIKQFGSLVAVWAV